jgi:predicted ABC-type ATPase
VHVLYLWLPSPDLAVIRVSSRVQAGGHNVPEADIRRRYQRGRDNFLELFLPLANNWEVYDTSEKLPRLITSGGQLETTTIIQSDVWQRFIEPTHDRR